MNVRSITLFAPWTTLPSADDLAPYVALATAARTSLMEAGITVQMVRLALPPWSARPGPTDAGSLIAFARQLEALTGPAGIDYVSLGPVDVAAPGSDLEPLLAIPALLDATKTVFAAAQIATPTHGINLDAATAAARVIQGNTAIEPNGLGNLRFAILANVPPGSPFFPAAYTDPAWSRPALALALESADLAVEAYSGAASLQVATAELRARLEAAAATLVAAVAPVAETHSADFLGLDFSLAPFPAPAASAAGALEALGALPFGAAGTLLAAAVTTQAVQSANYPRCGFSGLMLPVLEDSTLAARSASGSYDLHSLLLFSAVCGTGLDTIPLPGTVSRAALAAILLDVAALALRLAKPLTARLMPIPGKQAGDVTTFDFPYFANSTVLGVLAPPGGGPARRGQVPIIRLAERGLTEDDEG
ncbi:MAG: DUF711 family protein [Ardenticatenaceae bacterium]|nr:DUF711 family protein [Ardenticatenaceae bacterium]